MRTNENTMKITAIMSSLAIMLAIGPAKAALLTVDQIIFESGTGQNPSQISGTVDYTTSGNTATLLLRNTSPDTAFTDSTTPARMLLTGVGLQLPGVDITGGTVGGTVFVNPGSTALNFDAGQSLTDISNQYNYRNGSFDGFNPPPSGVNPLTVDTAISSVNNGQATPFATTNPATNINGPGYGALSALEMQFGHSTPAVNDTVRIVLTLSGPAPSFATVNSGNVVLAFGSPTAAVSPPVSTPDNGSTVALLGFTLLGVEFLRRKVSKNRPALN
jgi:hypothetical protein